MESYFGRVSDRFGDWKAYSASAAARGLPAVEKTHEFAKADTQGPSLVIVRDGRAAYDSFSQFREKLAGQPLALEQAVAHRHWNWSKHVLGWLDYNGPKLVLQFEDLRKPDDQILDQIGAFLGVSRTGDFTATVEQMHGLRPKLASHGNTTLRAANMEAVVGDDFWERHGEAMRRMGYER
ncbi:hypothetical protein [Sulfitobacter sp.]|uniref:hypothetical protein n=1 Tax=Sulfitobacter sp. TaxID=1903071 RepID=UPI003001E0F2